MQFIGLLPFFPVRSHPPNTTNGLKGRWPRILFLTPARNLIVQLMFELNVWNCVIFAGINVSWCTGKTLLKSHVIGILDIEFIFLPIQFPSLLPGVFPAPILHSHKWLETSLALGVIFALFQLIFSVLRQYSEIQHASKHQRQSRFRKPLLYLLWCRHFFPWPYIQYYFGGLRPLQKLLLSRFKIDLVSFNLFIKSISPLAKIKMFCWFSFPPLRLNHLKIIFLGLGPDVLMIFKITLK